MAGHMMHSVSVDPEDQRKHKKLRKELKTRFVNDIEPPTDPYGDKVQQKDEFLNKLQRDLRKVNGDPKGMNKMQKLSKKQLEMLKQEQLRQVYDEREVLKT